MKSIQYIGTKTDIKFRIIKILPWGKELVCYALTVDEVNSSYYNFMANLTYFCNLSCPVETKIFKGKNKIFQKCTTKNI